MIDASVRARTGVQPALDRIEACRAGNRDIGALQSASNVRYGLLSQLGTTPFQRLPEGTELRRDFAKVLKTSARADDAYVRWGDAEAGCYGHAANDQFKQSGDWYSLRATSSKEAFLILWNPVARHFGLPTRDQADI